jgi:hypothetical protein
MSIHLSSDESVALMFVIMAIVIALAFLVVVGVDSARSSPVVRRIGAWLKRRDRKRFTEHSERFRVVADRLVRSKELRHRRM